MIVIIKKKKEVAYCIIYAVNTATFTSFTIFTRCNIFSKAILPNADVEYQTGLSGTQDRSGSK